MKKLFFFLLLAGSLANSDVAGWGKAKPEPDVYINKLWVDHNVTVNGKLGMRIHTSFTVTDMMGKELDLRMYVLYDNGVPDNYIQHPGVSDSYHLDSGYLSTSVSGIRPGEPLTTFYDIAAFLPYEEFRLAPGKYDLMIDVYAMRPTGEVIAWLDYYTFQYTESESSRGAKAKKFSSQKPLTPSAKCDSMWVELDVKENSQLGLRLHFKFATHNFKDSSGYVFSEFHYGDGRLGPMKDKNGKFNTNRGGTCVWDRIKPGFESAAYDNFFMFFPYDEFEVGAGRYQIVIETRVIMENGTTIGNFPYYSFVFSKAN